MTTGDADGLQKITREWLLELGGWRVAKEGQDLAHAGRVKELKWEPPLLQGVVDGFGGPVRARLKIGRQLADVENLCSCRKAREHGTICAHVMALGFTYINRHTLRVVTAAAPPPRVPEASLKPALKRVVVEEASAESPPLALAILLPLDLAKSWKSGEMRIIVEGSLEGASFRPMEGIPVQQENSYAMDAVDLRALEAIERVNHGAVPGMWLLRRADYDAFFTALCGHPRISIGKKNTVQIRLSPLRTRVHLELQPDGTLDLRVEETGVAAGERLGNWLWANGILEKVSALPSAYAAMAGVSQRLSRVEFVQFYERELPTLEGHADVIRSEQFKKLEFVPIAPVLRAVVDGALAGLSLKLEALYGEAVVPLQGAPEESRKEPSVWTPDPAHPWRYTRRDTKAERAAQREVVKAGFSPGSRQPEFYVLPGEAKCGVFLANRLPAWRQRWQVQLSERLREFLGRCDRIEPEIRIQSSGQDWLSLEVNYRTDREGAEGLSAAEVQRLLQSGVSHYRRDNGRIVLLPTESVAELQDVLHDCQGRQKDGRMQIDTRYGEYLTDSLQETGLTVAPRSWTPPQEWKKAAPLPLPAGVENYLRDYQRKGVAWLAHLSENRLGGILADEMGLGKTLQTLAFLAWRQSQRKPAEPFLVVCPTSLVTNWEAEAARFTPQLKVLVLQGADRHTHWGQVKEQDLVITSYALLRRDADAYQSLSFDTVILDEAQMIKNRFSQSAQAVKALEARHRFVLTGTPMENALTDLWSIFDFLMPGYLGPATEFQERYVGPIVKDREETALARLRRRLRPFVLRRTKQEVVRELPDRIEQITRCELSEEQRQVYQAILDQGRREVFDGSGKMGQGRNRMAVLTALTRLRQACCHLDLLPPIEGRTWKDPSRKLDACLELVEEAVAGNHRILIFSQFVSLLQLVKPLLEERGLGYAYLDGSTQNRGEVVKQFQQDATQAVFLISLKAGGTGLNLTAADTVIHLDPWWNPAVEDQATARAHRIGQKRVVTSYKLIAAGTVEEKILKLQDKKKELIAGMLAGEEAFTESLTLEELQELLE